MKIKLLVVGFTDGTKGIYELPYDSAIEDGDHVIVEGRADEGIVMATDRIDLEYSFDRDNYAMLTALHGSDEFQRVTGTVIRKNVDWSKTEQEGDAE